MMYCSHGIWALEPLEGASALPMSAAEELVPFLTNRRCMRQARVRGAVRGAAAPLSLPALAKTLGLSTGGVAGRSLGAVLEVRPRLSAVLFAGYCGDSH